MSNLMSDSDMQRLLVDLSDPNLNDIIILENALSKYNDDPRVHFLQGSTLAAMGRLIEAHAALSCAIDIAPDFHIARFQLGFFQLTSGESDNALKTWAPLDGLTKEHYLRIFVIGLRHLVRDELTECITMLTKGISLNEENEPLNTDMQLIISQVTPLIDANAGEKFDSGVANQDGSDEASLTSILLQQSVQNTRH